MFFSWRKKRTNLPLPAGRKNMHLKIIAKNFPPLHYNKITRPAKVLIAAGGTQTDFVVDVLLREIFLTQFF
jgi:hypothetical protein